MNGGLHSAADVTEQAGGDGHGQLVKGIKNRRDQCCDQPDDDEAVGDIHLFEHDLHREMEKSYMTYAMEIEKHRREAKNIGIAIGREEGLHRGLSQGLKQGQAVGRKEGLCQTALSMLENNVPIELISKYTSLTEQEINDLAKEHNLL